MAKFMEDMECPCRDCGKRHAFCHGSCKAYLSWKKEYDVRAKKAKEKESARYMYYTGRYHR